jgi:acyl-CoA dehydrogenase family protein 10
VSRSAKASKPRAVIFDLGGVVVPSPQPIFDRVEEKHGLKVGSLVSTIKATGNGGSFAKMERGEYTVEQFCEPFREEYLAHTKQELTRDQCQDFVHQLSDFTKLTPHPGVMEMFQKLKSRDVKVAILTNNFRWEDGRSVFPQETPENVDVVSSVL